MLWHQPKGTAEDAMRDNRSTQPVVFSSISDSEPVWDDVEFYVKWKGQSYLHCEWKSFADLQNVRCTIWPHICWCNVQILYLFIFPWHWILTLYHEITWWFRIYQLSGFKKVLNYIKRATEERRHKKALSREEVITYLGIFFF